MEILKRTYLAQWCLLTCLILAGPCLHAQNYPESEYNFKVFDVEGQKVGEIELEEIEISGKRPSKSKIKRGKKRLAKYSRLKWHVHKVYPYAVKVGAILEEINAEIAALPEGEKKRKYIKKKEKSLFGKYENDIRRMTRTQGRILVKLVHRQTGNSMYHLIKDMKSGTTAVFWQSIGLIFGINLKTEYVADDDENWMIERHVQELESGGYNIVYKTNNFALK